MISGDTFLKYAAKRSRPPVKAVERKKEIVIGQENFGINDIEPVGHQIKKATPKSGLFMLPLLGSNQGPSD